MRVQSSASSVSITLFNLIAKQSLCDQGAPSYPYGCYWCPQHSHHVDFRYKQWKVIPAVAA